MTTLETLKWDGKKGSKVTLDLKVGSLDERVGAEGIAMVAIHSFLDMGATVGMDLAPNGTDYYNGNWSRYKAQYDIKLGKNGGVKVLNHRDWVQLTLTYNSEGTRDLIHYIAHAA